MGSPSSSAAGAADGMAPTAKTAPAKVALTVVGLPGVGGTLVLTYTLTGTAALAYRGGFLLSALSAAAIILGAVCVAGGPLARVLSVRPMVWMGTVSYGAYLWHFPVFIELDAGRTGLAGLSLLALRFATTFVLAGLSYYLVERPVMEGTFWRTLRAAGPALAAMGATVAVVVVGTIAPAVAAAPKAVHPFPTSRSAADPPVVTVLGDSTALTLGFALAATAPARTTVDNGGLYGCGFAIGSWVSSDPPTPAAADVPGLQRSDTRGRSVAGAGRGPGRRHPPGRCRPLRGRDLGGPGHGATGGGPTSSSPRSSATSSPRCGWPSASGRPTGLTSTSPPCPPWGPPPTPPRPPAPTSRRAD